MGVAGDQESFELGTPGGSARRQAERRRVNRESKTRQAHPRLGRLLLKFQEASQSEKAWNDGAIGEEAVAGHLARACPEIFVLHDRRMPGSRANIDHIAIAPSGILVIDAKRYRGKIEVRSPLMGDPKLLIAGRDKTKLVEGLKRQIDAVRAGLATIEQDVPVEGCFCFVNPAGQAGGTALPLFRTLSIEGLPLFVPRKLSKRLNRTGRLSREEIGVLSEALIELFPAA